MRIAIIADIHSNLEALIAVFADVKKKNVKEIYCVGDVVGYGANPNECIGFLRKNNVTSIQGNHDFSAVSLELLEKHNKFAKAALIYTNNVLTNENREFLKNLPKKHVIGGKNRIMLVHGSPRDELFEYVYPTADDALILEFINGNNMLVCGHTHIPDLKRFSLKVFLNPGSVGQPRNGIPQAQYAIIDTENTNFISLEKVNYDVDAAAKKIIQAGLPRYLADRLFVGR